MKTVPLRYTATLVPDVLPEGTDPDHAFYYIDIAAVDGQGRISLPQQKIAFSDAPSRARRLTRPGDSIVSTVRTYLRAVALIPNYPSDLVASTGFAVLRSRNGDPRFLNYSLRSEPFIESVVARSVGVSYPAITAGDMLGIETPCPSLQNQRRIADFLDDRVSRIDRTIAARRRQAALVTERSNAQIATLVRPEAAGKFAPLPMVRLGSLMDFYAGAAFPHAAQGRQEGDLPFLKVADLAQQDTTGEVSSAANWVERDEALRLGAHAAPAGTILMPKVGAALLTNRRAILARTGVFDNNIMGIAPRGGNPRFWYYVMRTVDLGVLSNPGPVPSVNRASVAEIRVPCPSVAEQDHIAARADEITSRVPHEADALTRSIELLTEYKQSLITAAVTGQLDVTTASTRIPE